MAKCLVGTSGGGKVTVTGLAADTLVSEITAKVFQGSKEIVSVDGKFGLLAFSYYAGGCYRIYWDGDKYQKTESSGAIYKAVTVKGKVKKLVIAYGGEMGGSTWVNAFGVNIASLSVGIHEVGEDGAFADDEILVFLRIDERTDEVGGQQVGGELDAGESGVDSLGQRGDGQGFGQSGDSFEEDVPVGEQADQQRVDQMALSHDDLAHFGAERIDEDRFAFDALVEFLDVDDFAHGVMSVFVSDHLLHPGGEPSLLFGGRIVRARSDGFSGRGTGSTEPRADRDPGIRSGWRVLSLPF